MEDSARVARATAVRHRAGIWVLSNAGGTWGNGVTGVVELTLGRLVLDR